MTTADTRNTNSYVVLSEANPVLNGGRREVVFIDASVADYQTLVDGVRAGIEVVLLDPSGDELGQMAAWAESHSDFDAIHVISHGAEGKLYLGSTTIDEGVLVDRKTDFAAVGTALNADGDLLIYGCSVAAGESGKTFVASLAAATKADVVASDDITGSDLIHADWQLEFRAGSIETTSMAFHAFSGTLSDATFTFESSDGTVTGLGTQTVTQDIGGDLLTITATNQNIVDSAGTSNRDITGTATLSTGYNVGGESSVTFSMSGKTFDLQSINFYNADGGNPCVMQLTSSKGTFSFTLGNGGITEAANVGASADATKFEGISSFTLTQTSGGVSFGNTLMAVDFDDIVLTNITTQSPSTPDLDVVSDSGVSTTDDITNDTTPTFTIAGVTDGATVTLFNDANSDGVVDGGETLASGIASGTSIQLTSSALTTGIYNIKAIQNVAGTDSSASSALSVTIDTTAPGAPGVPDLNALTDSGWSNGDEVTNSLVPKFRVSLSGTDAAEGDTIELLLGGASFSTPVKAVLTGTNISNTYFDFTLPSGALGADGSKVLTAQITDAAGNVGTAGSSLTVTLDTTNPSISTTGGSLAYTENDAAKVIDSGATLTETGSAGRSVMTVQITANNEASDTLSLATDTSVGINVAPTTTTLRNGTTAIGTVSATEVSNGTVMTITFAASATASDIQSVIQAVRYHNSSDNPGTSDRTVTFELTDGAGNAASSATRTITVASANDVPTAIALSTGSISTFDAANKVVGALSVTDLDDTTWTYSIRSITDPNSQAVLNDNSVFNLAGSGAVATNDLRATDPSSLTAGTYTVTVRATDSSSGYYDQQLSITVDDALVVNATAIDSNTVDGSYANDVSDGSGLDLQEALHYANNASGAITVKFAPTLAGTITLPSTLTVRDGISFQMDSDTDSRSLTLQANNFTLGGALTTNVGSGDTLTVNSNFTDNGAVTSSLSKTGAGTLVLGGTNSTVSTGLNDISATAGTLRISADSNLGTGTVTLDGATLMLASVVGTVDNAFTLGSSNGTINVSGAATTLSGNITGNGSLIKTGGQLLTLSGTNDYSGGTSISGVNGLSVTDGSNLGSGAVTFATLDTGLTITGSGVTLGNSFVLSQSGTLTNGNAVTLTGSISGSGDLSKAGAGELTLSGDSSSFSGAINLDAGRITATHNNALGNVTGGTTIANGSTLRLGDGLTIGENVTISGVGINAAFGALMINEGTSSTSLTGTVTLAADASIGTFNTGDTLTISGAVSGDGYTLSKVGSGTLALSGNNNGSTFATTVSGGTLQIEGSGNLGSGSVTLADGTTLDITDATTVQNAIVLSGNSTIQNADAVTLSGVLSGNNNLTKTGAGALTLTNTNTYAGTTTVSAGTLLVNGSLNGSTGITISSGATLGGTGSLFATSSTNTLTLDSGATLGPGTSPGTLTVNGNLDAAGTLNMELGGTTAGTGYDQLIVNGTVDLAGATLNASFVDGFESTLAVNDVFTLIENDATDAVTGSFEGLAEGATVIIDGKYFQISYAGGDGNDVVLTAIKAPSTKPPVVVVDDGDGVTSEVESSVPSINGTGTGDGNGDGVPDTEQSNVTSTPFRDTDKITDNPDAPEVYVTLVAESNSTNSDSTGQITSIEQLDRPDSMRPDLQTPLGMIGFTATASAEGATEDFTLIIHSDQLINGYWKLDSNNNWVNLASAEYGGQVLTESGVTRLLFSITDGGEFDSDPTAGIIGDPGAPGYMEIITEPDTGSDPDCIYDPFALDADDDGIPDDIELVKGTNSQVKDNDIFNNNTLFVEQVFRDVLGREGDSAGVEWWSETLDNTAEYSQGDVIEAFVESSEFQQGAGAVARLYHGLLDRSPDYCGWNYWLTQVNSGTSMLDITRSFLVSSEFLDVAPSDDTAFLTNLYEEILDRVPDAPGLAYWVNQMNLGMEKADVITGFLTSSELKANTSGSVAIDLFYLGLLDQDVDASGASNWASEWEDYTSLADFFDTAIGDTTDYHDRFLPEIAAEVTMVGVAESAVI